MMTLGSIEESYCKTWFDNYYKITVHNLHGQVPKTSSDAIPFYLVIFKAFFSRLILS